MWSGKLPDLDAIYASPQILSVYDAIVKRHYLTNYGLQPEAVDSIPDRIFQIWNKVAVEEKRKKDTTQQ